MANISLASQNRIAQCAARFGMQPAGLIVAGSLFAGGNLALCSGGTLAVVRLFFRPASQFLGLQMENCF